MRFEAPADWAVMYAEDAGILLGKGNPVEPEGAVIFGFGWEFDLEPVFDAFRERGLAYAALDPRTLPGGAFDQWAITGGDSGAPTVMFQLAAQERQADGSRLVIQYGRYGVDGQGAEAARFDRARRSLTPLPAAETEEGGDAPPSAVTAQSLFAEINALDDWDLDAIEGTYVRVIEAFPHSDQAQESYWRLSNMYIQAYDPPRWADAAALLEQYKARYPGSAFLDERFAAFAKDEFSLVDGRLLRIYEALDRPEQAAVIYERFLTDPAALDEGTMAYALAYADVLAALARRGEAMAWLRAYLALEPDPNAFMTRVVQKWLAHLEGQDSPAEQAGAEASPAPTPAPTPAPPPATAVAAEPQTAEAPVAPAEPGSAAEEAQTYRERADAA